MINEIVPLRFIKCTVCCSNNEKKKRKKIGFCSKQNGARIIHVSNMKIGAVYGFRYVWVLIKRRNDQLAELEAEQRKKLAMYVNRMAR